MKNEVDGRREIASRNTALNIINLLRLRKHGIRFYRRLFTGATHNNAQQNDNK